MSRAADRPRNAIRRCGIAWLPTADDGDGAVDADVTVLQLRQMLGAGEFKHAVQNIGKVGDEPKNVGEYFPRGRYISTTAFEIAAPCQLERR